MQLFVLIFLSVILLFGCGSGSGPSDDVVILDETTDAITVLGGKEGIEVIVSPDKRKVRYKGEVVNKGNVSACFIDITFSSKDISGNPIDQGDPRADIKGLTLTNFGTELQHCLKPDPGQDVGTFDTGEISLSGDFADFEFKICELTKGKCRAFPVAQGPRIPLTLVDFQVGVDSNGMRSFSGRIKNAAPTTATNAIACDVSVHFTVLNDQEQVVGRIASGPMGAQLNCIGPGVLSRDTFDLNTNIPVSATCDGCFYYRFEYSE
jgi:hypothetical protein